MDDQELFDLRASLENLLSIYTDRSVEEFVHAKYGEGASFETHRSTIETVFKLNQMLLDSDLKDLPVSALRLLVSQVDTVTNLFQRIWRFDIAKAGQNWVSRRQELLDELQAVQKDYFLSIAPILSFALVRKAFRETSDFRSAGETAIHQFNVEARTKREELRAAVDDAKSLLQSVRETVQETGITAHAKRFEAEAESHQSAARGWLLGTAGIGVLTLASAVANLFWLVPQSTVLNGEHTLQQAFGKLLIFSILFTAFVWCARVYRSHRHNVVVNRHRANALSSFEAFVKSTADLDTKNAVLLQATQSIYAPQLTGYVQQDAEPAGTSHIIELYRSLNPASK
jgi:hypothetical protein